MLNYFELLIPKKGYPSKYSQWLYILALIISVNFIVGCNSGEDSSEEVISEIDTSAASNEEVIDSMTMVINRPSLWIVEIPENSNEEKLKQPNDNKLSTLSATQMISAINDNFRDVQMQFTKISHDTIYVTIPESEKLTSQMGSTGAYNYMAAMVYNLTELKDIKYVNIDFKEGDHAVPGTFTRENFKQLR